LNEELIHVEPEWIDREQRRFQPIVTDFTRTTQLTVRYRLDDVLRASADPCPCGRVTLSLDAIEGRADDLLFLAPARGGSPMAVFPDTVRRAMAVAGTTDEYRIEQHGEIWRVRLEGAPIHSAIQQELDRLAAGLGLQPPRLHFDPWTGPSAGKRRRIRCITRPLGAAGMP
jgi:putative adenylate-forming enzyme